MTALAHRSTWLTAALYHNGFLCLFLADGTALLYGNCSRDGTRCVYSYWINAIDGCAQLES